MNPDEVLAAQSRAQVRALNEVQQMRARRQTQTEFQKSRDAERRQQALKSRGRR